ncbi:MAG: dTDP-glucose 4,6-dehydratase [Moraxellaceae bacterium]
MSYQPRVVLVTGGAGFIGAHFVRFLLASDPTLVVINLDALTYASDPALLQDLPASRHVFVQGDITDTALVLGLLREHAVDGVVHLAAESHVDRSISGPAAFLHTNIQGTASLLEAVRQVWIGEQGLSLPQLQQDRRFLQVSTDEVFGDLAPAAPAFREQDPYAPSSPYAASKAAGDHLLRAWARTYGLPVLLTRCSNNYGTGQHAEKFLPTIIRQALAGAPIPVYGDGLQSRDWLHVQDHCRALDVVLRQALPGSDWNVGGRNELSNLVFLQQVCAVLDVLRPQGAPHERLLQHVADRPGHDRRYAMDPGRLESRLGWRPQQDFARGLQETVAWYLQRAC